MLSASLSEALRMAKGAADGAADGSGGGLLPYRRKGPFSIAWGSAVTWRKQHGLVLELVVPISSKLHLVLMS